MIFAELPNSLAIAVISDNGVSSVSSIMALC